MREHDHCNLVTTATPLTPLLGLGERFPDVNLFMKNDALAGGTFGGNKTRMLEYLLADAFAQGCDTILTFGSLHSNHCRLTATFASRLGLEVELVLIHDGDPGEPQGSYLLSLMMGANVVFASTEGAHQTIDCRQDELRAAGRKLYFIPGGGHSLLGAQGYIDASAELLAQLGGNDPDFVVLPTGTGTTQAGLLAGLSRQGAATRVIGVSIARPAERCVNEIQALLDEMEAGNSEVSVTDAYLGEGYGKLSLAVVETMKMLAREEGLFLDPIYNAKAFHALIGMLQEGELAGTIVYLNTGGLPALFAPEYAGSLAGFLS